MLNEEPSSFVTDIDELYSRSIETSTENVESSPDARKFTKEDSVHSGESKFKVFSFEPPAVVKNSGDVLKNVEFWKFVEKQNEITPTIGYMMHVQKPCEKQSVEKEITWQHVAEMLRAKGLDKIAGVSSHSNDIDVETCHRINICDTLEDDFQSKDLEEFNPQKKICTTANTITDVINTDDKSMQTINFEDIIKEMNKKLLSDFDDEVLKQLTEQYPDMENVSHDQKTYRCQPCDCTKNFFGTDHQPAVVDKPSNEKCPSGCGETHCKGAERYLKTEMLNEVESCVSGTSTTPTSNNFGGKTSGKALLYKMTEDFSDCSLSDIINEEISFTKVLKGCDEEEPEMEEQINDGGIKGKLNLSKQRVCKGSPRSKTRPILDWRQTENSLSTLVDANRKKSALNEQEKGKISRKEGTNND